VASPAKWPRFPDLSRGGRPPATPKAEHRFTYEYRGTDVLTHRASTGFGGLLVVTIILLAVQAVTGVGAFPL
jgi:hypothetical protein